MIPLVMSEPILTSLEAHTLALTILGEHERIKRIASNEHTLLFELEYEKARAFDRIVKACRKELAL